MRKPIAKASPRRMMLQFQRYILNVGAGETDICGGHAVTRIYSRRAELWGTRRHGSARTQPGREPTSDIRQFRRVQAGHRRRPSDAVFETVHSTWVAEEHISSPTRYPVILGIRDELHEADSLLLFGDRLIVQTLLRSSMLQLIHECHLGDKCKSRAGQACTGLAYVATSKRR